MCSRGRMNDNVLENTEFRNLLEKIQRGLEPDTVEQKSENQVENKKQESNPICFLHNNLIKQIEAELLKAADDEKPEDISNVSQVILENINALLNFDFVAAALTLEEPKITNLIPDLKVDNQMAISDSENISVDISFEKLDTASPHSQLEIEIDENISEFNQSNVIQANSAQLGLTAEQQKMISDRFQGTPYDFSQLKPIKIDELRTSWQKSVESQETLQSFEANAFDFIQNRLIKEAEFTFSNHHQSQPVKSGKFASIWTNPSDKTESFSILEAVQNQTLNFQETVHDGQTVDSIILDSIPDSIPAQLINLPEITLDIPLDENIEFMSQQQSFRNTSDLESVNPETMSNNLFLHEKPLIILNTIDEDKGRNSFYRIDSFKKLIRTSDSDYIENQDLEAINYQVETDYDDDVSTTKPLQHQIKTGLPINTNNITEKREEKLDSGLFRHELADNFTDNSYTRTNFVDKVTDFQSVSTSQADRSKLTETIMDQIVSQATLKVSEEHQEINIQLKPDFLGRVNIKLAVEKGIVNAEFLADSQVVKETISASLPQLRLNMQELGMTLGDVSVNLKNHHNQRDFSHDQPRSFSKRITRKPHQANILTFDHPLDAHDSTSRINLRV